VKLSLLVAVPPGVVTVIVPLDAPAGTVAAIDESEPTENEALAPANLTAVAPVKPEPPIVTLVPTGPLVGLNPLIVGAGTTVKLALLVAVPPGAVTVIFPLDAPEGTVAVISLPDTTPKDAPVPANFTAAAFWNDRPRIVTAVPTPPLIGLKPLIDGGLEGAAPCAPESGAGDTHKTMEVTTSPIDARRRPRRRVLGRNPGLLRTRPSPLTSIRATPKPGATIGGRFPPVNHPRG
jgi:hypothetical protein